MSVRKVVPLDKAEWLLGPAPAWVQGQEPDWNFTPSDEAPFLFRLVDDQRHVASQACYTRSVRQLLTTEAVQRLSQVELDFDPADERLIVHELSVWRQAADGQWQLRRPTPEREAFMLRQREQQLEQQILNGRASLMALLEDVRVGDAIDMAWTVEPRATVPGLHYSSFHSFSWMVPVARACLTLWEDAAAPVHVKLFRERSDDGVREEQGEGFRRWVVEHRKAETFEPNIPSAYWPFTMLEISGWASWQEVAQFVTRFWAETLAEAQEGIAEEAAQLRAQAKSLPEATLAAIRFVQQEVRYLGVDFGSGGGILPNAAGTVLRRRFGDCKDKAVLLTALLRALDVEAWPMLVAANWQEAVGSLLASTSAFSHAIVKLNVEGQSYYVDATDRSQGGRLERIVPAPYGMGLVLSESTTDLEAIPPALSSELEMKETFHLDAKGKNGRLIQTVFGAGGMADGMRAFIMAQGRTAFSQARIEATRSHFPAANASPEQAKFTDDLDANTVTWELEYSLPTWGPVGEKPPPGFHYGAHGLFLAIENLEGPEQRQHPWALRYPLKAVQKAKKEQHRVEGPGFLYTCDVGYQKRQVTFDYRWTTRAKRVDANDWELYRQKRKQAFEVAGANVNLKAPSLLHRIGKWMGLTYLASVIIIAIWGGTKKQAAPAVGSPSSTQLTAQRHSQEVEDAMRQATAAWPKGEYQEALRELVRVAPWGGSNLEFQLILASAYLDTGELNKLEKTLSTASNLAANNARVGVLQGRLLERRGLLPDARRQFERVTLVTPKNADAWLGLARVSQALGDDREAVRAWTEALNLAPAITEARRRLAQLLWKLNERPLADETMLKFADSQPRTNVPLHAAAIEYLQLTGRSEDALARARALQRELPESPFASATLASTLRRTGHGSEAVRFASTELPRLRHVVLLQALGWAAEEAGMKADAEQAFAKWCEVSPRDAVAQASYGSVLRLHGKDDDARRVLQQATEKLPVFAPLWQSYGEVLQKLHYPGANEALQKAAALRDAGDRLEVER